MHTTLSGCARALCRTRSRAEGANCGNRCRLARGWIWGDTHRIAESAGFQARSRVVIGNLRWSCALEESNFRLRWGCNRLGWRGNKMRSLRRGNSHYLRLGRFRLRFRDGDFWLYLYLWWRRNHFYLRHRRDIGFGLFDGEDKLCCLVLMHLLLMHLSHGKEDENAPSHNVDDCTYPKGPKTTLWFR